MAAGNLAVDPVMQLATIGVLGVGAQWIAWRLRVPAIVLMLGIGLLAGPLLGVLDPKAALGDLMTPIISIAVAVILFEGGLTLNFHQLRDASQGVTRLVLVGAPLGWITSALALHYVAGVSWAVAAVFGGIMIVTGPTVIAPLLRQAKLSHRPAALLQWEAIVNDPIGALAAVLAYEVIVVSVAASTEGEAAVQLIIGLVVSSAAGVAGGYSIAQAFKRGWVPEYMKVPVLFVVLLGVFAGSNALLHESGLLAVTIMGVWLANANLPSYEELRLFKEHATVLLVSGVSSFWPPQLIWAQSWRLICAPWPLSRRSSCWRVQSRFTFPCWAQKFHVVSVHWWHSQARVGLCWSLWRDCLANGWLPWALQMVR